MHTMKHHRYLFFAAISLFCTFFAYAGDVTFDPNTRYSRLVIDSCLYHFKANTKAAGFAKYDSNGNEVVKSESERGFDYVPGLVAKAVIEAVDYYQTQDFAKPWFYSIAAYANTYYSNTHTSGSLDDLNACKMYFGISDLTRDGAAFANTTTYNKCQTAKTNTLAGLKDYNTKYVITTDAIADADKLPLPNGGTYDVTGGWWHKKEYPNQMWCDGQYMGPALLAQLVAEGKNITGSTDRDWTLIAKQFDITWTYLWDEKKQLLYHAFCADGGTNTTSHSCDWAGLSTTTGSECYHSAEYWGRAEGWYVLALVDVLEQMDKAELSKSDERYTRLLGYLQKAAAGLKNKRDSTNSGCWYQLLAHDGSYSVTNYEPSMDSPYVSGTKTNYLEASASAIFTAFFLKSIRLGYLDKATYESVAKEAYKGLVKTFLKTNVGDGNGYALIQSCKSAGLGGGSNTGAKTRTGSAAYYLLGSDVGVTTDYTEGKILGAFILAAVEYERVYLPVTAGDEPSGCKCLKVSLQ